MSQPVYQALPLLEESAEPLEKLPRCRCLSHLLQGFGEEEAVIRDADG